MFAELNKNPIPADIRSVIYGIVARGGGVKEWTTFEKMYKSLKAGGFLITYCAQGHVKRTLKSLNFVVQALPGPIGKREITKAVK